MGTSDDQGVEPVFSQISLKGFLSYGPGEVRCSLHPLNVIIGPNGSGKSNLVEALSVLRAVPKDLPLPIRRGGGVKDWLWQCGSELAEKAQIEVQLSPGSVASANHPAVYYRLVFGAEGHTFQVFDERIEAVSGNPRPYLYFGYTNGRPMINAKGGDGPRSLERADIDPTQSILSQRRDPDLYPELNRLANLLGRIRIYRSFEFGPDTAVRQGCSIDARTEYLEENLENLPARLAVLKGNPATKRRLLGFLSDLAPGFDDLEIVPEGGRLVLRLTEGERSIRALRLSDGTLRYLVLLAILLDPGQTSILVIEEPELGLHPDVLPTLAKLMVETSAQTQLLVTTHSTQLLDALTDHADSVLVCEKSDDQTQLTRLDQAAIDTLKDQGGLGWLWMRGHIGGTRW